MYELTHFRPNATSHNRNTSGPDLSVKLALVSTLSAKYIPLPNQLPCAGTAGNIKLFCNILARFLLEVPCHNSMVSCPSYLVNLSGGWGPI